MLFARKPQLSKPIVSLVALLLSYGLVVALVIGNARSYGTMWLGFTRCAMALWAPELHVDELSIEQQNGQLMFVGLLSNKHTISFNSKSLAAGTQVETSTLVGHALQAPMIILCLLLAWPNLSLLQRFSAAIIAVPMIALITAIDIPLVLVGTTWDAYYFYLGQDEGQRLSIQVMKILNNGGRLALAIAATLGCIYLPGLAAKPGKKILLFACKCKKKH